MNSFFPYLILALCFAPIYSKAFSLFPKVHLIIGNALPNNTNALTVHCKSSDDDLGTHTLWVNEKIQWEFRENVWGSTLYFCNFWWSGREKSFAVFDRELNQNFCSTYCPWLVKEDGFYLHIREGWPKLNTW